MDDLEKEDKVNWTSDVVSQPPPLDITNIIHNQRPRSHPISLEF